MCREEFLHYLRIREWQDSGHGQLRNIARELGRSGRTDRAGRPSPRARRTDGRAAVAHRPAAGGRRANTPVPAIRSSCSRPARCSPSGRRAGCGGGPGRDQSAVRSDRGAHRPEAVERVGGRPGPTHLQRAALGCQARRGDGLRAGDALRAAVGPRRRVGYARGRARARPRFVHQARARRGGLADPAPLLPRQRRLRARARPSSRSAPGAATCSSATTRSTRFYDARSTRRGRFGAALRRVVEEAAARDTGLADVHPRRSAAYRRHRRRPTARTSGRPAMSRCH